MRWLRSLLIFILFFSSSAHGALYLIVEMTLKKGMHKGLILTNEFNSQVRIDHSEIFYLEMSDEVKFDFSAKLKVLPTEYGPKPYVAFQAELKDGKGQVLGKYLEKLELFESKKVSYHNDQGEVIEINLYPELR